MNLLKIVNALGVKTAQIEAVFREELGREYDEEHAPATFTREEYVETHTKGALEAAACLQW